ncbi:MAG: CD225/dispanin family protein [Planctomycetales bacterium]|nr:CD225/dispanin family protein [Planctomycetales bacterium]
MSSDAPTYEYVPTQLFPAILVMIFFCSPLGLVALLYAIKTHRCLRLQDMNAAMTNGRRARRWVTVGFVMGIAGYSVVLLALTIASL